MKNIEQIIKNTNEKNESEIDWTKAWAQKYTVLKTYQNKVNIAEYSKEIRNLLNSLKEQYNYNELEAMLVLKDILYHEWKDKIE